MSEIVYFVEDAGMFLVEGSEDNHDFSVEWPKSKAKRYRELKMQIEAMEEEAYELKYSGNNGSRGDGDGDAE